MRNCYTFAAILSVAISFLVPVDAVKAQSDTNIVLSVNGKTMYRVEPRAWWNIGCTRSKKVISFGASLNVSIFEPSRDGPSIQDLVSGTQKVEMQRKIIRELESNKVSGQRYQAAKSRLRDLEEDLEIIHEWFGIDLFDVDEFVFRLERSFARQLHDKFTDAQVDWDNLQFMSALEKAILEVSKYFDSHSLLLLDQRLHLTADSRPSACLLLDVRAESVR